MKRYFFSLLGILLPTIPVSADPIHAIANGEYWHHDSGWVFPEKFGEFVRVGVPQDVAGSRDAVAYYAREVNGGRVVASVDVFPQDSEGGGTTLEGARTVLIADVNGAPGQITEEPLPLKGSLIATHVLFTPTGESSTQVLYFASAADWRVRIRITIPPAARTIAPEMDAFVQAQPWDKLH